VEDKRLQVCVKDTTYVNYSITGVSGIDHRANTDGAPQALILQHAYAKPSLMAIPENRRAENMAENPGQFTRPRLLADFPFGRNRQIHGIPGLANGNQARPSLP
jgi:hypothetical protein